MFFIIGFSGVGKSTLARHPLFSYWFSTHTDGGKRPIISASKWIKDLFPPMEGEGPEEYRTRITGNSTRMRHEDHLVWVKWFRSQQPAPDAIVEGIRDPTDFISVFNPHEDTVVHLEGGEAANEYDDGVRIIMEYMQFLSKTDRPCNVYCLKSHLVK